VVKPLGDSGSIAIGDSSTSVGDADAGSKSLRGDSGNQSIDGGKDAKADADLDAD
jgi:hypothetical protein